MSTITSSIVYNSEEPVVPIKVEVSEQSATVVQSVVKQVVEAPLEKDVVLDTNAVIVLD